MPDIDDIRREIDGLHEASYRAFRDHNATTEEYANTLHKLRSTLGLHWPTISAALAEAETIRRKAKAFDAIAAESVHGIRDENGEWRVYRDADFNASLPHATGPDLLRAIEAALAAKEGQ